ncbi:MAG: AEC family transporter [Pseudomonadota bacterium]
MSAVIDVVLPVFALIAAGYAVGRAGVLGDGAQSALNRFTYNMALPALLFIGMARLPVAEIFDPAFHLAYNLAWFGTFLVAYALDGLIQPRRGADDQAVAAMAASFPNVGYMGVPLLIFAFGDAGQPPALIAAVLASVVQVPLAMILIQLARGGLDRATFVNAFTTPLRSPIVIAPAAGMAVSLFDLPLPTPIAGFADILGAAAAPCALVSAGMFLVGKPIGGPALETTLRLTALKLFLNPLIAWLCVMTIAPMPPLMATCVILLSALPTGALVFTMADRYQVFVQGVSSTILASTAISAVTLSILFALLNPS